MSRRRYLGGKSKKVVGYLVEYIESTGEQWIDLGYTPKSLNGKTTIIATPTEIGGTKGVWGFVGTGANIVSRISIGMSKTPPQWFGGVASTVYTPVLAVAGKKATITMDRSNQALSVDDQTVPSPVQTVAIYTRAYLFHRKSSSALPYGDGFIGYIHYFKEEQSDIKMELKPFLTLDNEYAMYDIVGGTVFKNRGTGAFMGSINKTHRVYSDGSIEEIVPYIELEAIESTGTQQIDTGLLFGISNRHTYRIKFTNSSERGLMGYNSSKFSYWGTSYGDLECSGVKTPNISSTVINDVVFIEKGENGSELVVNGQTIKQTRFIGNPEPTDTFVEFNLPSAYKFPCSAILYKRQASLDDVVVADFIPVQLTQPVPANPNIQGSTNGEVGDVGMWCKVRNCFFGNQGTGAFIPHFKN